MVLRAHTMLVPFDASSGAALTSATVNVYQPGTVTPVAGTLFDKSGGTLANPLTSDATTGLVDFYMNVAQEVDLLVSKTGFTARTYSNVPVLDDAGNDLTALMTATGDIVYASAANTPARLAIGATGSFLTNTGASTPGWSNTISTGGLTITAGGLTVTAGNVGVGTAAQSQHGQIVSGSIISGATTQTGMFSPPTSSSGATTEATGVYSQIQTAASAFTATTVSDFHAANPVKGAGSTITSAYGLLVDAVTAGGTNNYGISIAAPSGGSGENLGIKNLGAAIVNGAGTTIGFFTNAGTVAKQTVTGSRGGNAALASLLTALNNYALLTDSSTA